MKQVQGVRLFFFFFILCLCAGTVLAQAPATGKAPVIIIPGLTGSELVNTKTGEEVWFKPRRSKDDDIRLPISPNILRNRDNLVAKDIVRSVKFLKFLPESEIYERLIDALQARGGYKEGKWDAPPEDGYQDTFYVFAYDWRRDNVENARRLVRQVETLKRRLGKPNLRFNVIGHSMGGMIARYAAMYGNAELPAAQPKPTWAGARHFDKIFLVGTPNEGSVLALDSLLHGYGNVAGGVKLPFVQDISRFDVFTMPVAFQLLPHQGSLRAYDENLQPIEVDIFDPATWEKYGWSIWQDEDFTKKFSPAEQKNAKPYFIAALARAKQFQAALDANTGESVPVKFYLIGADCKDTPDAILLVRDEKKNRWETKFKPSEFTRADGTKITDAMLKPLLVTNGDSVVTKRSLGNETAATNGNKNALPIVSQIFQCEEHGKLVTNLEIQDKLFTILQSAQTAQAQ